MDKHPKMELSPPPAPRRPPFRVKDWGEVTLEDLGNLPDDRLDGLRVAVDLEVGELEFKLNGAQSRADTGGPPLDLEWLSRVRRVLSVMTFLRDKVHQEDARRQTKRWGAVRSILKASWNHKFHQAAKALLPEAEYERLRQHAGDSAVPYALASCWTHLEAVVPEGATGALRPGEPVEVVVAGGSVVGFWKPDGLRTQLPEDLSGG